MVFSLADSWYFTLGKLVVLLLASTILFSLIRQSLQNFTRRINTLRQSLQQKHYRTSAKHLLGSLINVLFIWIIIQMAVLLLSGFFGFAPKQLVNWHFQEGSLIAVIGLCVFSYCVKRVDE